LGFDLDQGASLEGAGVPSEYLFFDENMPISADSSPLSGSRLAIYMSSCAAMIGLTVLLGVIVHFKRTKALQDDIAVEPSKRQVANESFNAQDAMLTMSADERLAVVVIKGAQ
jgi:hypothetical protein